jgi:hypothetical protein
MFRTQVMSKLMAKNFMMAAKPKTALNQTSMLESDQSKMA